MLHRIYSSDEKITLTQLKAWNYSDIDTTRVQDFAHAHNITGTMDLHTRFSIVKSPVSLIYGCGDRNLLNQSIIWIVWPRRPSTYGQRVVQDFLWQATNIVTISWWADGIDELVHRESISQSIPTIMILWWGIWRYLQSSKRQLLHDVVQAWWLVLSEFKIFSQPATYTFPQRNRIIAGLSDHLIVPEAGEWSWSLLTARNALMMHRPVWIFPQSIYEPMSRGALSLLPQAQILCDIWSRRSTHYPWKSIPKNLDNPIMSMLYQSWASSSTQISDKLNQSLSQTMSEITMLEIQWSIKCIGPDLYWV